MPLSVRSLNEADLDIADIIVMAAYKATRSRKTEIQNYMRLQPDGWMLASLDDNPVGLGGLVNYGAFAYLGMMSVLPSMQGKAVGKELMKHLIQWADERACPTMLLDATEAGSYLYKQFAFVEESKTALWRWDEADADSLAAPLHQAKPVNLTELRATDLPALVAFDAPYFGAQRALVLKDMLSRYPQRAFAIWDEMGCVSGYLFAQEQSIGPWVAHTIKDAEYLLAQALTLPFAESTVNVNISIKNSPGEKLLERYGFSQLRKLSYMRHGKAVTRDLQKIYGQASFALG